LGQLDRDQRGDFVVAHAQDELLARLAAQTLFDARFQLAGRFRGYGKPMEAGVGTLPESRPHGLQARPNNTTIVRQSELASSALASVTVLLDERV